MTIMNKIIKNKDISMISFTGGVESGKIISNKCGIKKLALEFFDLLMPGSLLIKPLI